MTGLGETEFSWEIVDIGVKVAALMTEDIIKRRLKLPDREPTASSCPAAIGGDLDRLSEHFGVPFVRGPDEIADLPAFLGRAGQAAGPFRVTTCASSPRSSTRRRFPSKLCSRRARALSTAAGADVIDLGCLPETPFPLLGEAVRELKAEGFPVSVDSANLDELQDRRAGRSGLSCSASTRTRCRLPSTIAVIPVLIPSTPGDLDSLGRAIEAARKAGISFIADPVLDPDPFRLCRFARPVSSRRAAAGRRSNC